MMVLSAGRKLSLATTVILFAVSSGALASGFQSFEQNAAGLGNSYAGQAAEANDASIEFDNPAGLTRIKNPEVALGGVVIQAHTKFTGESATNQFTQDVTNTASSNLAYPLGTNALPDFHIAIPMPQDFAFGFGITVPYGLSSEYDKNSMARYMATYSELSDFNFSPSLAYKVNEHLSLGAGVDMAVINAKLNGQVDTGLLVNGITDPTYDSTLENSASGTAYGWNVGLLYQFTPQTRMGVTYRSQIHEHLTGDATLTLSNNFTPGQKEYTGLNDGTYNVETNFILPDMTTLSFYHDFNDRWAFLSSVNYTHWSCVDDMVLHFSPESNLPDDRIHEPFHDSWRLAVGTNYKAMDRLTFRVGAAYDESPKDDETRTMELPDADRYWLSLGAHYDLTPHISTDLGYAHLFIKSGSVNQINHDSNGDPFTVTGKFDHSYANLIGLQINFKFF